MDRWGTQMTLTRDLDTMDSISVVWKSWGCVESVKKWVLSFPFIIKLLENPPLLVFYSLFSDVCFILCIMIQYIYQICVAYIHRKVFIYRNVYFTEGLRFSACKSFDELWHSYLNCCHHSQIAFFKNIQNQ